jgi:iron-sulfur cluster repair protein YtfE (RIC family)
MDLTSTIKSTSRKVKRTLTPESEGREDADILATLKHEHEEAGALLEKLTKSDSGSERKSILKKLQAALIPHLRAEEKVVYDAIIALKDKKLQQDGKEGALEHELVERTLAKLMKIANATSPEFSAAAKVLKELVTHHVEEEERNVWADVRKNFSTDDRERMNGQFEAMKQKVRLPS